MSFRSLTILALSTLFFVLGTVPASAGPTDTTPPQLVAISISTNRVDNTTDQSVTVDAVITDDSSGVWEDTQVQLWSPSTNQETYAFFEPTGAPDSYSAVMTIPAFSEVGIWKDWSIWLIDNYDNEALIEYDDLLARNLNLAVGVGTYEASYPRFLTLKVHGTRARGTIDPEQSSTCSWWVPISLQLKTRSGWKKVGAALADYHGNFSFFINEPARGLKYRAIASPYGIGTPAVTTCSRASIIKTSS